MTEMTGQSASLATNIALPALDFATLATPEEALAPVRRNIYHSAGPGYHLFRGFLTPELARHMQRFWVDLDPLRMHKPWYGTRHIFRGCPNYSYNPKPLSRGYFNFFWNHPADEATHAVSMQIQWLRNRVMGRTPFEEIFPLYDRAANYRVVISKGNDDVKPHSDWTEEDYIREPARLQATLYLSTPGVDYEGDGFLFRTNSGKWVTFGRDVSVAAGDLIFWRHSNEHAVLNVRAAPDQDGFVRIIYAPDEVHATPPHEGVGVHLSRRLGWLVDVRQVKYRLAATPFGQRVLLPLWHSIKGR